MKKIILPIAAGALLGLSVTASSAATLDDVKAKGFVQCGVSQGLIGFSNPDASGAWLTPLGRHVFRLFVVVFRHASLLAAR